MLASEKLKVMIAEDEFLIAQDVAMTAVEAGFEVVGIAANGEHALAMIAQFSPDAAILDIKMPRMNGLEAARRIRDGMPIPVVIMTAYESSEFLTEATEAGVGAYLVKPPNAAQLRRAVELAVARHDDLLELRKVNQELREAIARVETLEGILPICASCKKIRDGEGSWHQVEVYIGRHSDAEFSHGVCPECMKVLYPEFVEEE
jgi:YesN/AraC family two-component response regulator